MKKYKKAILSILLVIGIYYIIFSPPILICKGGIENGIYVRNVNNSADQFYTPDLLNGRFHKPRTFDYFYFLHFKFWQDLSIEQLDIVKSETQEAVPEKLNPFLYRINQNLSDHSFNFFGVIRGDDEWYYRYYVQGG